MTNQQPDRFFTTSRQQRLGELMARWRICRDSATPMLAADQAELEELVETELEAAAERGAALCQHAGTQA